MIALSRDKLSLVAMLLACGATAPEFPLRPEQEDVEAEDRFASRGIKHRPANTKLESSRAVEPG